MTALRTLCTVLLTALICGQAPRLATAQEAQGGEATEVGDTIGSYVVRPGDTLKGITERFLGEGEALWRENWRLNPKIKDPNLLIPGQELQIILDRKLPPRTVQVTAVARQVEQKPNPNPWTGADIGDLLQEEDGLRTGEKASAEVLFDDETKLRLTEESLIFLRRIGTSLRGVSQETVEIVEGQADLTAKVERGKKIEIELIIGETTAKPTAGSDGRAETRARQGDGGDTALMVFEGESAVAAGGAEVRVPTGMGTTVAAGGAAPSPPQKLLRAPKPTAPSADSSWSYSNPRFAWRAVPGAVRYVVEVCADTDCARLVERATEIVDTDWTPDGLPIGQHFWRVTAVAESGLDGYPSTARQLSILSTARDEIPPVVATIVLGNPAFDVEGRAEISDSGSVLVLAMDDASGVAEVRYRWGELDWRSWRGEVLTIPSTPGAHRLQVRATDEVGRTSEVFVTEIERIETKPAPPDVYAKPSLHADPPVRMEF